MHQFATSRLNVAAIFIGLTALTVLYVIRPQQDQQTVTDRITKNLIDVTRRADDQAHMLMNRMQSLPDWDNMGFPDDVFFFLLRNGQVIWWSENRVWPVPVSDTTWTHYRLPCGNFLLKRFDTVTDAYLVVAIPLQWSYRIQNEYLRPGLNPKVFGGYNVRIVDTGELGLAIQLSGKRVFSILPVSDFTSSQSLIILLAGTSLLVVVFLFWVNALRYYRPGAFNTVAGWCILLIAVRWLMLTFRFPAAYVESPVFNPQYFASSRFNPSLGDLFFNAVAVLVACIVLVRQYSRFRERRLLQKQNFTRFAFLLISATAVFFGWLYPYVVVQTLYNNSDISLGISESLAFDYLRMIAFAVLVISWISAFLFIHVGTRILLTVPLNTRLHYAVGGLVVFIVINLFTGQSFTAAAFFGSLFLAFMLRTALLKSLSRITYRTILYLLVALVSLTSVSSIAIQYFAQARDVLQRKRMAQYFLAERDNLAEYLLHEVRNKISQDAFIRSRLGGPFLNREAVKQKIKQIYLAGYISRYKADIFLFSSSGEPLEESLTTNFIDWLKHQEGTAQRTEYEGLYFQRPASEPSGHYLLVVPVSREGDSRSAFVVIQLSIPRFISENVYPELLVDNRYQPRFPQQSVDYAVYHQGKVLISSGGFAYDRFNWTEAAGLLSDGVTADGYHHVGVEDADGRMAIISRPVPAISYRVADFSFLLIIGLGFLSVVLIYHGLRAFRSGGSMTLVARLQLLLYAVFFISLITVSVITLGVTTVALQNRLNTDFRNRAVHLAGELTAWINEGESVPMESLGNEFLRKMRLTGLDANLFSASGVLMATTQPLIFEYQLQAPVANPVVLKRMYFGEKAFISDEKIGELKFFAAYAGIYAGEERRLTAFIEIPYFQSQRVAEELQTGILAQVLTVFLILLLVLSVLSLIASRYITRPLNLIARQIGRVSITGNNQPLHWMSRDEIGLLVQEYNRMLIKLKESITELERTQRERTWREIAQQVAHEIKNPLTPMKLTLQQMQRQMGNADAALRKAVETLLEQIEVLNGIATSFSAFAKMPEPVMERVNLVPLLETVVRLHEEAGKITLDSNLKEAWVNGDAKLLNRILSNLVLNAIQAKHPQRDVQVQVRLFAEGAYHVVSVADNGTGIDEAIQDKIFFPHFSTRKSGSGLGLAIARQGIEQMGGSIWFQSAEGSGTTFFVKLPMA
ncbi:MAG: HAMP domain-containing histidine kinase [Cyclobacteriaceae bacterium]|nr:HAMP domain-containing histidine kinase [Cyclobacteriaceae bacterium]